MTANKSKRFVLLLERETNGLRDLALDVAGEEASLLIAHSVEAALDFAKHYKPSHALIAESQTDHRGKFVPALLLEFSPETEVMIVSGSDENQQSAADVG
jgi:ActR/RegA family two-component response regulator